ncbi:MAG TPA: Gfo/Idh/MocA family oxidoreductase [Spirochaetales bacterium]|nr:Gfo/Idh/MocA family oxidoreductase [Spirochaetales bacterium]HRY53473.1 Gfo/Idh/MocA family oxidoreductase [Spirochaetia bacterium]
MEAVRWGILSTSGHYRLRVHQPLSAIPEARVAAIASREPGRARAAAERLGIGRAYGSYEELLADPRIEAVYLPLPNTEHAAWALKALEAGKHVLCEKPLAMDAAEARRMAARAAERGLLLMEAFMYRFQPRWRRAREIVGIGEIGAPRAVHAWFSYSNADPANIRNRPETGGGGLYDIGCYAVSAARWLLGAEPDRALALVERDPSFRTDRLASGILDFPSGARSTFTVSTQAFPMQRVELLGDKGSISIPLPFNAYPDCPLELEVSTSLGTRRIPFPAADQYGLMFAELSRAIREGRPAPIPVEDGIANMAALDALFRSEREGGWASV